MLYFQGNFYITVMLYMRGKFIKLIGFLMLPSEVARVNKYLVSAVGVPSSKLVDEGWYDTQVFSRFMDVCTQDSTMGDRLYYFVGSRIYPTVKKSGGLPPELVTPLDVIKFEDEVWRVNHKGEGIVPRKYFHVKEGDVLLEVITPGYNTDFMRGAFAGILLMFDIKSGKVEYLGDDKFHITW
ncbi:MAG: hypothetical protein ACJA2S_005227 [Cyclobacteriaceae bacterium]|jgi:hypothetical protein